MCDQRHDRKPTCTVPYTHNTKFQKLAIFQLTPCLLDPAVTSWLSPELSQDLWLQQKVVATWQGGDCTPGTWRTKENDTRNKWIQMAIPPSMMMQNGNK